MNSIYLCLLSIFASFCSYEQVEWVGEIADDNRSFCLQSCETVSDKKDESKPDRLRHGSFFEISSGFPRDSVTYQGKSYTASDVKMMELPRELGKALVISDLLFQKYPGDTAVRTSRVHVLMAAGQYRAAYQIMIPYLSMEFVEPNVLAYAILLAAINNEVQPGMRETLFEMISPGNVQYFEHYCDSSREIAILANYVIGASFTRTGREKIGEHYFRWALQDDPTNAFVIYVLCQRMALNRFPAEGKPLMLWGIRHAEGDLKREMESTLRQREQAYQEHYGPVNP